MIGLKVNKREAERIKDILNKKNIWLKNYRVKKEGNFLIFPISDRIEIPNTKIIEAEFEKIKKSYKDYLDEQLDKKELPSSYDIIGDIIIIEKADKKIAEALLKANKNIKTILAKEGIHEGEFRIQKLKFVAGENKKITIHKENNVKIMLDVEKIYFSPRLSTERKRISEQIKEGENILVMFSGCGPYPLVISKNTKAKKITAIEKNPIANEYARKNILLNKVKNIDLIEGDVKEIVPEIKEKFDRIIMPLPKGAENFLDLAFSVSKKNTIIHFYDFEQEKEIENAVRKINSSIKSYSKNIKYKVINIVKCGQYSPGKYRVCIDFQINDIN